MQRCKVCEEVTGGGDFCSLDHYGEYKKNPKKYDEPQDDISFIEHRRVADESIVPRHLMSSAEGIARLSAHERLLLQAGKNVILNGRSVKEVDGNYIMTPTDEEIRKRHKNHLADSNRRRIGFL